MISGSLHDVHETFDNALFGSAASLPGGSIGDLIFGVLNIPSSLITTVEFIMVGFGS